MPQSVRRFLWALGASLAAHLALLSTPAFTPPEKTAPSPVIEARLAAPPPPTPAPQERPKPRPQPAKPVLSAPPVLTAPETETPVEEHVPPPPEAEPAPDGEEPPPAAGVPGEKAPPPLPREAWLRYTLFKGENGLRVGRVATTWKARGDSGYSISSVAEASGLFSLFVSGRHVQISEGEITPRGLRPAAYWMQRGQQANKTDSARFDWTTMSLTLGTGMEKRSVSLPEGTQDLLSALYQFAFILAGSGPPPDGVFRLPITNGRKLDSYGYRVVGEEGLKTPLGKLKTLHLSKVHDPGEEGTEIWLAADYHYLPVRIRVTDKQGDSAEQVIDEIRLSPEE